MINDAVDTMKDEIIADYLESDDFENHIMGVIEEFNQTAEAQELIQEEMDAVVANETFRLEMKLEEEVRRTKEAEFEALNLLEDLVAKLLDISIMKGGIYRGEVPIDFVAEIDPEVEIGPEDGSDLLPTPEQNQQDSSTNSGNSFFTINKWWNEFGDAFILENSELNEKHVHVEDDSKHGNNDYVWDKFLVDDTTQSEYMSLDSVFVIGRVEPQDSIPGPLRWTDNINVAKYNMEPSLTEWPNNFYRDDRQRKEIDYEPISDIQNTWRYGYDHLDRGEKLIGVADSPTYYSPKNHGVNYGYDYDYEPIQMENAPVYDSSNNYNDWNYGYDYNYEPIQIENAPVYDSPNNYDDLSYGYDYNYEPIQMANAPVYGSPNNYDDLSYGYDYNYEPIQMANAPVYGSPNDYNDWSYGYDYDYEPIQMANGPVYDSPNNYNDWSYGYDYGYEPIQMANAPVYDSPNNYNDWSYGYDYDYEPIQMANGPVYDSPNNYNDWSYGYDYDYEPIQIENAPVYDSPNNYNDWNYGYDYDYEPIQMENAPVYDSPSNYNDWTDWTDWSDVYDY
jgi:hypothetical protein